MGSQSTVNVPGPARRIRVALPMVLLAATALGLLVGCSGDDGDSPGPEAPDTSATLNATPSPTSTPSVTSTPTPWSLTIAAVGDIMLGRSVAAAVTHEQPDGPFAFTRDLLQSADLTIGNLECVISDLGVAEPKAYTFRAPLLAAKGLAVAGFDAVSLSNNHSLDFGPEALLHSGKVLQEAGVVSVGAGRDDAAAYRHRTLTADGVRVAVLGLAEVPNEGGYDMHSWAAAAGKPGIAWIELDRMRASVQSAGADADVVVVMFHFGAEFSSGSGTREREVARAAIDAGADLVVGSHPHVLQEVEEYGAGLIAYSLGNFVFDGFGEIPASTASGVLVVTFSPDGLEEWRVEPVQVGWDGLPRPPG